jgi:hypothetical protein
MGRPSTRIHLPGMPTIEAAVSHLLTPCGDERQNPRPPGPAHISGELAEVLARRFRRSNNARCGTRGGQSTLVRLVLGSATVIRSYQLPASLSRMLVRAPARRWLPPRHRVRSPGQRPPRRGNKARDSRPPPDLRRARTAIAGLIGDLGIRVRLRLLLECSTQPRVVGT